jgi:5-methylcytosine-specific restriction protein A
MAKSVLDALYHTTRWRFARAAHLAKHPLCQRCESFGRVRAASLVDHNPPCGDSVSAFWDPTRYRSLCAKCHAAVRAEQKRGYSTAVDVTGKPIDPRHLDWSSAHKDCSPIRPPTAISSLLWVVPPRFSLRCQSLLLAWLPARFLADPVSAAHASH